MADVAIETAANYAAADAETTLRLMPIMQKELERVNGTKLLAEIDMPLTPVLADMEMTGALIDTKFFAEMSQELAKRLAEIEKQVFDLAGKTFNLNSPQQLSDVLFNHLRLEPPDKGRKTTTGFYSTSADVLDAMRGKHPALDFILEHRELSKLKSTSVDALPAAMDPNTGRVHTSYSQIGAVTGRLSSNNPNLQNIPIRTIEGREVRKAFIPRDADHVLLSADYSQIELRLIAEISGDEAMLDAFQKGLDIHTATAAGVYGVPLDQVTSDQRRAAKTVNFSIIYGAGATNLSNQLGIKRAEAKELIENYFKQYSGLKKYMTDIVEFARTNGYVETLLGRRRKLRDIDSRNGMMRSMAERIAINTPIQGTAADLIKVAMINIREALIAGNFQSKMILQVHDELVFDVQKDELERLNPIIFDKMTTAIPNLKVPILVEMGVGENWLEAH